MTIQPNLPDFEPYGHKPCSTEFAGKPNDREKLALALDALTKIAAGTWNRRERKPQELREYAASILRKISKERGNG